MDGFVLDVSACMPWCCEDETTEASEFMLASAIDGALLHVPSLWTWEIVNAIAAVIRRRRISVDRGREFLDQLGTFNFKIDPSPRIADLPRLHSLATLHNLTAYDAAYLELAKRLPTPLATLDAELIRAARAEGVDVV